MYQFTSWCFLCGGERNVDIEIRTLDELLRESIGQFSLINFTLQGVPNKICQECYKFLKEVESRKSLYANAEQMFMELLRMKNKSVDLSKIRAKYNLDGQSNEPEIQLILTEITIPSLEPDDIPELEDIPEIDFIETPLNTSKPTRSTPRSTKNSPLIKSEKSPPKTIKILNPTIRPKIISNSQINLLSCDLCSHTCSTKTSIERHMKQIHLKASSNSFKCQKCSKTFAKKVVLQNHMKIHDDNRPTYSCPHCDKVLSSQTAVSNHIKWIHKEQREFKCSSCSKMFATKGSLKEHEKIHSEAKQHICPVCKKSYKTASTLTQHLDTHDETEYHCPDCGIRLNSKRTLRQHMLKHSNVTRFTCKVCNAQFKRTKAYKEHLISIHTNLRAYECDWCDKTFANGANCRKHKKEAHPKEVLEADKNKITKIVKLPKLEELLIMSEENKS